MSEMIERAARAICLHKRFFDTHIAPESDFARKYVEANWREYYGDAMAAIMAMREPTAAMSDAAHDRLAGEGLVENVYTAMIDAALKDD